MPLLEKIEGKGHLCVPLHRVKTQLRVDHEEEDQYILDLIQAGTSWIESALEQTLLVTRWRWVVEAEELALKDLPFPKGPLWRIVSLTGHSEIETGGSLAEKEYIEVGLKGPYLKRVPSRTYKSIEIIFESGYADRPEDLPENLTQAIMNYVGVSYESRTGVDRKQLLDIYALIHPYRVMRVG